MVKVSQYAIPNPVMNYLALTNRYTTSKSGLSSPGFYTHSHKMVLIEFIKTKTILNFRNILEEKEIDLKDTNCVLQISLK